MVSGRSPHSSLHGRHLWVKGCLVGAYNRPLSSYGMVPPPASRPPWVMIPPLRTSCRIRPSRHVLFLLSSVGHGVVLCPLDLCPGGRRDSLGAFVVSIEVLISRLPMRHSESSEAGGGKILALRLPVVGYINRQYRIHSFRYPESASQFIVWIPHRWRLTQRNSAMSRPPFGVPRVHILLYD
jgi:hypothetical protein